MLSATHELRDGARVRLRLTRPSDWPLVRAFLESDSAVRPLVFYDPRERVTIAATMPVEGGEQIVGLANAGPTEAETAVFVAEEFRGRGIGTLLTEAAEYLRLRAERRRRAA